MNKKAVFGDSLAGWILLIAFFILALGAVYFLLKQIGG